MTERPVVSVGIPAFNVAPFVRQAVDSVLTQTFGDLELIVVDDGSTDGTADRLADITDPRLRVIRLGHAGLATARNTIARAASGQYIAFLDGDDFWEPRKLERHIDFLAHHPDVDLTFSMSRVVNEEGHDAGWTDVPWSGTLSLRELLVEDVIVNGSSAVMRREALRQAGDFDTSLPAATDHDMWLRIALLRSGNIAGIPSLLTYYRRRRGQASRDWQRKVLGWELILGKMRRQVPDAVADVEDKAAANMSRVLSSIAYEAGQRAEARRLFLLALRQAPGWMLSDRRSYLLGGAALTGLLLPQGIHRRLDQTLRKARAAWRNRSGLR